MTHSMTGAAPMMFNNLQSPSSMNFQPIAPNYTFAVNTSTQTQPVIINGLQTSQASSQIHNSFVPQQLKSHPNVASIQLSNQNLMWNTQNVVSSQSNCVLNNTPHVIINQSNDVTTGCPILGNYLMDHNESQILNVQHPMNTYFIINNQPPNMSSNLQIATQPSDSIQNNQLNGINMSVKQPQITIVNSNQLGQSKFQLIPQQNQNNYMSIISNTQQTCAEPYFQPVAHPNNNQLTGTGTNISQLQIVVTNNVPPQSSQILPQYSDTAVNSTPYDGVNSNRGFEKAYRFILPQPEKKISNETPIQSQAVKLKIIDATVLKSSETVNVSVNPQPININVHRPDQEYLRFTSVPNDLQLNKKNVLIVPKIDETSLLVFQNLNSAMLMTDMQTAQVRTPVDEDVVPPVTNKVTKQLKTRTNSKRGVLKGEMKEIHLKSLLNMKTRNAVKNAISVVNNRHPNLCREVMDRRTSMSEIRAKQKHKKKSIIEAVIELSDSDEEIKSEDVDLEWDSIVVIENDFS